MKISAKGIVMGGVTDVLLSVLLGIPLTYYVLTHIGISGTSSQSKEQATTSLLTVMHSHPRLYAIQLLIGFSCSVIGGYVAARVARHDYLLNGVLASWLCLGLGIYSLVAGTGVTGVPLQLALIAITPCCYALGAFIHMKRVAKAA